MKIKRLGTRYSRAFKSRSKLELSKCTYFQGKPYSAFSTTGGWYALEPGRVPGLVIVGTQGVILRNLAAGRGERRKKNARPLFPTNQPQEPQEGQSPQNLPPATQ